MPVLWAGWRLYFVWLCNLHNRLIDTQGGAAMNTINQIQIYQSADGSVQLDVKFDRVWT
jgi:G:T-mismatch repair DNA endonuclease (very short patch repair protein)